MHVYPAICTLTAGILAALAAFDVINSWSQTVRDKEFLVEMRLQNLEPGAESKTSDAEASGDLLAVDEEEED